MVNKYSGSTNNSGKSWDIPLGVSTWCFSGLVTEPVGRVLDGAIPATSEVIGQVRDYFRRLVELLLRSSVRAVEVWYSDALFDDEVASSLRRLAAEDRIHSMHGPFGPSRDLGSLDEETRRNAVIECKRSASLIAQFGGKLLVVHGGSAAHDESSLPLHVQQSVKSLREIGKFCSSLNIQVALEHLSGLAVGNSDDALAKILDTVGMSNIGVCLDTNHVFPTDRLIPSVHALGRRLLTLHVSDYDGIEEKHWLPGLGVIDWLEFLNALREAGYQGAFIYEARFDASNMEEAISTIEENYRMLKDR